MEKKRKVRFDDPNANQLKRAKGERTLVLNGEHWYWKTDGYDVYIRAPNGKRIAVSANMLLGGSNARHDWYELITPFDIKNYIDANVGSFG